MNIASSFICEVISRKVYLYLLFLSFLVFSFTTQAQYRQSWIKGIGTSSKHDYPKSIAIDQNRNVYVTGAFAGTIDLDPGAGTYFVNSNGAKEDVYVVKYDASGNFVWGFAMGSTGMDSGNGIMVDDAGGAVYVTGLLDGQFGFLVTGGDGIMDIDPSPGGTYNLTVNNSMAANQTFLAKYDLNGNLICGFTFESLGKDPASGNFSVSISKMVNGEFLIGGTMLDSVDFDPGAGTNILTGSTAMNSDLYFTKVDQNCNVIWTKLITGDAGRVFHSIEQSGSGDVFIAGNFKGTADFDPSSGGVNNKIASGSGGDLFLACYDASGNNKWANAFGCGGIYSSEAFGITADNNGDPVVCGYFQQTVDFGGTSLTGFGSFTGFFGKYNKTNGSLVWVKRIGNSSDTRLKSVTVDSQNDIYIFGLYGGQNQVGLDIDPTAGVYQLKGCSSYFQFFGQYDNNGNIKCGNFLCPSFYSAGISANAIKDKVLRVYKDETVFMAGMYKTTSTRSNCNIPVSMPYQGTNDGDAYISRFDKYAKFAEITGNDTVCIGSTLPLTASGGSTYTWSTGEPTALINAGPTSVTNYSVVVDDSCACSYPDTAYKTLQVSAPLNAVITGDSDVCSGNSLSLSADNPGVASYTWSTGETGTQITIYPTSSTTYSLTISSPCGSNTDDLFVTVNYKPDGLIVGPDSICEGDAATLSYTGTGTVLWSTGDAVNTITVTPVSTTGYTITATNDCGTDMDSLSVKVVPPPLLDITGDTIICLGESTTLTAQGSYAYVWSNGESTASISIAPASDTWYYVNDGGVCPDTQDGIEITVNPLPPITVSNDTLIKQGDSLQLKVTGGISRVWSPSQGLSCDTCANPTATPQETTSYCATVTDANGCSSTECITVQVEIICNDIFVPNAFSPNGDGQNDEFRIFANCIDKFSLVIFNRWGKLVFETSDATFTWDGKHNETSMSSQIFFYSLKMILTNGTEVSRTGDVALIR